MPTDETSTRAGTRALLETVGLRIRPDLALVAITGDDTRMWLNGQITNQVGTTEPGTAVYALVLSLKGRILTDLWALDRGDRFDLVVPQGRRAELLTYLDQYIIMEDVELAADDTRTVISLAGPRAKDTVAAVPDAREHAFPCDRLGTGGLDVVIDRGDERAVWDALVAAARERGGQPVDDETWEHTRILRGIPRYGVDFGDFTYPQEAGLKTRAISFQKGCYQGQEAVVMLEHRGKPPKRLVQLRLAEGTPPTPDATIFVGDVNVGRVTSATSDPEGGAVALGYMKRDHAALDGQARIGDATARIVAVPE